MSERARRSADARKGRVPLCCGGRPAASGERPAGLEEGVCEVLGDLVHPDAPHRPHLRALNNASASIASGRGTLVHRGGHLRSESDGELRAARGARRRRTASARMSGLGSEASCNGSGQYQTK